MPELTPAARLAYIFALGLGRPGNGLPVGDLGRAGVDGHLKLADQPVEDDFEVQLAHAGQQGLAGFGVGLDNQGRVLGRQALQGQAELFRVSPGLGLDRQRDDRVVEGD